jgi:predicted  nucleic acid-binding Zn-ribbon protein
VARRWVVVAGPYEAPEVVAAERQLERFLKDKLGVEHRYLGEHLHNGLPLRAEVERQLARAGGQVRSIGHGNLERWLLLQCLSMYMDYDPALRGLAASFHAFYNERLYASDHAEPVYRHAVVAAFDGALLPDAEELLGPPRAPAGTLAGFGELAGELVAFDRERAAWRGERDKLRESVRVLEQDLAGHRETLAETCAELERVQGYIDDVEDELADERVGGEVGRGVLLRELQERAAALAALKNEREAYQLARASLESDLGEHRKVLAALQAELAETREVLAAREAELERHREAAVEQRQALEQDRDGQRAVAADLGRQLEEQRALAHELRGELEAHGELGDRLRERIAELESAAGEAGAELKRLRSVENEFRRTLEQHHRLLAEHAQQFARRDAELEVARRACAEQLAELERLRGQLADRLGNLRRAFSPRRRDP